MITYSIAIFNETRNQIISYDKKMSINPSLDTPFLLNRSNFGLSLGFYYKPNTTFQNISSYLNNGISLSITQISLFRASDGTLTQT